MLLVLFYYIKSYSNGTCSPMRTRDSFPPREHIPSTYWPQFPQGVPQKPISEEIDSAKYSAARAWAQLSAPVKIVMNKLHWSTKKQIHNFGEGVSVTRHQQRLMVSRSQLQRQSIHCWHRCALWPICVFVCRTIYGYFATWGEGASKSNGIIHTQSKLSELWI